MDQSDDNNIMDSMDALKTPSAEIAPDADDATAVTGNQRPGGVSKPKNSLDGTNSRSNSHRQGSRGGYKTEEYSASVEHVERQVGSRATTNSECVESEEKPSSFAQLVKSWETYIADAHSVDKFQPMQVLQSLRLCGAGHELPRLTLAPSTEFTNTAEGQDPFEPIILRHTHSTPLQYRPSFFNDYSDGGAIPPPSQLDATRRSSSTPSRGSAFQQFSARNSFGAHLHSASNFSGAGGRSAFGFPLHRSSYSGVSTESNIRSSAFNPVPFSLSTTEEEPHGEENTSIEVMDLGRSEADKAVNADDAEEQGEVEVQLDSGANSSDQMKPLKKSAAARAARFLSDVGVLRRKKKGARGSIVSGISSDNITNKKLETFSAADEQGNDETNGDTTSTEFSDHVLKQCQGSESDDGNDVEELAGSTMYHQLDSDVDEEFDRYQSIENSGRDSEDSPGTIPSPDYQPIEDDRMADSSEQRHDDLKDCPRPAVRIQVSCSVSRVSQIAERISNLAADSASPSPGELHHDEQSHSPGAATRSSATTTTSGHTTQATSTTSTTGNASGHSQISETDREVMEAIKEGKRRRRQESQPENSKNESDSNVTITSSSSTSSTANGYVALSGSPGPLRDGANVVADRFFRNSQSPVPQGSYAACTTTNNSVVVTTSAPMMYSSAPARSRTTTLPRKSSSNSSPTSCSLNSVDETPPTFVSYLDRQATSDLTSLRGATEVPSCRGETEEREDSPAQIVGYPAALLRAGASVDGQENAMSVLPKLVLPSTESLYSMLDKFRSRPPRSPSKGMRAMTPTTPPPRLGSPAYHHQLSPPRNIVDHRIEGNVSRPYVVRTNPSTQKLVLVSPGSHFRPGTPLVCIPVGSPNYSPNHNRPLASWPEQPYAIGNTLSSRTYEEHSIEILKSDSKDEMICQRFASTANDASTTK